jgi:hypothetical protein
MSFCSQAVRSICLTHWCSAQLPPADLTISISAVLSPETSPTLLASVAMSPSDGRSFSSARSDSSVSRASCSRSASP